MSVVVIWVVSVLGITALVLFIAWWPDRPIRERRPAYQDVYRPAQTGRVVSVADDDDQAILDHQRLVAQYKDMIDELYNYGEQVVRRSEASRE